MTTVACISEAHNILRKKRNTIIQSDIKCAIDYNRKVINQLLQICQPLFLNNHIAVFEYSCFFDDGKCCYLSSNLEWQEFYLKNLVKTNLVRDHINKMYANQDKYAIFDMNTPHNHFEMDRFVEHRHKFGIWNDFNIYNRQDGFIECWTFAAKAQDAISVNYYLNKTNVLNGFIMYFTEQASEILNGIKSKRVKISNDIPFFTEVLDRVSTDNQKQEKLMGDMRLKKFSLPMLKGSPIELSRREIQCLNFKSKGKKSKEIARLLKKKDSNESISHRVVDFYFNSINKKARAHGITLSELIDVFLKSPLNELPIGEW